MSLNKIKNMIKEWNDKKNTKDIIHSASYESALYYKDSNVGQILNEVSSGNRGNGIQY